MARKYIGKTGERIGQPDDWCDIMADNPDEAMQKLLGYSADQWPESDGPYEAVAWLEDSDGNVIDSEEVEINADGTRSQPS